MSQLNHHFNAFIGTAAQKSALRPWSRAVVVRAVWLRAVWLRAIATHRRLMKRGD